MTKPQRKHPTLADHIYIKREANILKSAEIKYKYTKIVEESFILSLSESLPPRYPPKIDANPYTIRVIPAFRLSCFLSSTDGNKWSIVLVITPNSSPSKSINPIVYFI